MDHAKALISIKNKNGTVAHIALRLQRGLMRQILYISRSLIGANEAMLDSIMVQAQHNNTMDGITGLLWTDGHRFAQALEGEKQAIDELLVRIARDPRHAEVEVVSDRLVDEREFGSFSMMRPAGEMLSQVYERRMRDQLHRIRGQLAAIFEKVMGGSIRQ